MPAILVKLDAGLLLRVDHEVSLAPPGPRTRLGAIRDLLREALDARSRSRGEPVFAPRAVSPPPEKPAPKAKKPTKAAEKAARAAVVQIAQKALDIVMDAVEAIPNSPSPPPVRRAPASGHVRRIGTTLNPRKGNTR